MDDLKEQGRTRVGAETKVCRSPCYLPLYSTLHSFVAFHLYGLSAIFFRSQGDIGFPVGFSGTYVVGAGK